MAKSQKQNLAVGGIQLNVFSPSLDPGKAAGQVAVLFLLHGRLSKADALEATATKLVEKIEDKRSTSEGTALRLVVVTFVSEIIGLRSARIRTTTNLVAHLTGPEESRCQNDQPSREPTMELPGGRKQPSTCVNAPIFLADWRITLTEI